MKTQRAKAVLNRGADFIGITVVFVCHDGKGNFLFNKRSHNCRDEHGCWDPGGGSVEFGETVEDTLKKEIREEYCTEIINWEFLGYGDILRSTAKNKNHWLALYFKVLVDKSQVSNGEPDKFDEISWFRLEDLPTPLHSQFPQFLEKYRDRLV